MCFKNLRISVSILAVALLPVGQASAWSLGIGHMPSCAYICLDRTMTMQSSCQDLKCICKQPDLLASNEACFRKECDLNSLMKALKLKATCQESYGTTSPPPVDTTPSPSLPPGSSSQPAMVYPGYPYMTTTPPTNQAPPAYYYPYPEPYPRVITPNTPAGGQLPPGPTPSPAGAPAPGVAPQLQPPATQPQVPAPATQAPGLPSQASAPPLTAISPIGGAPHNASNPTSVRAQTTTSATPLFLSRSNSSGSAAASDAPFSSAPTSLRDQANSSLLLLALFSSLFASLLYL
ncbi:hypothetical protein Pst134EA_019568 [Puccinia striiformis f. sp. tritici]|uniref:hypothetical protein n=1 Tax=Puccinia striiformis f. sp. tritici TaxID=168172 RepID=UPI0020072783|nr:hypothetical protein Pst134EA_019568 [Puccinia striiformis f. sp. tritici]KAH9459415.1 hypothetical protein Pst134EA_019568 [Puccinia striiformis f. sp. tritici]KAI9610551.1 hypothetical protein H4Q26_006694 [Puccinia striiformis f. sp. tritici PST-130]